MERRRFLEIRMKEIKTLDSDCYTQTKSEKIYIVPIWKLEKFHMRPYGELISPPNEYELNYL